MLVHPDPPHFTSLPVIEPLVLICHPHLEHHHSYILKNAIFAVYIIYCEFENLLPDAPELLQTLVAESDTTCKMNAFVFLAHCTMPTAVEWILQLDDLWQMSVIKVIRHCKNDSAH